MGKFVSADFLIDTGADRTCVSRHTASKVGISPSDYTRQVTINGVTGSGKAGVVKDVDVALRDASSSSPDVRHIEPLDEIFVYGNDNLLGRDILDRFEINFSASNHEITMHRDDLYGKPYEVVPIP